MKTRIFIILSLSISLLGSLTVSAQVDSVIGQISATSSSSFAGGISGDGRLIVFESNGDAATENPRNSDRNREIFVFDYAQRRIYQITDTKSVLIDTEGPTISSNTRVDILNTRPVMSNDGRWIAFSSNATSSVAGSAIDGSNPGNFDGNAITNSVSGGDILDISAASGGETIQNLVQPSAASLVSIRLRDSDTSITAFSITVAGTDSGGNAITENFAFANGLEQTGTQMFASVTSVTLDSVAGNGENDTLQFTYGDGSNPLVNDANTEIWLYEIPAVTATDLSQGNEIPVQDLSAGTFIQATNSAASRLPTSGSTTQLPLIAQDNSDVSINDDGNVVAFVSNRNLVGTGNEAPDDNPEIFTYVRNSGTTSQVTQTTRGTVSNPLNNGIPSISGNGMRVMFVSNADNPIVGMTGGNNTDINEEVFFADLDAAGAPSGNNKQVTATSPDNPGDLVNIINFGRRMSRDGKYIAFDSFADLTNENSGSNFASFSTFLYDADADTFRRINDRSDADADAPGGDVGRFPNFTDYDVNGTPQTLVMETRLNITAQGVVAANEEDGLNPIIQRPVQLYSYPLNQPAEDATFTRLTQFPPPPFLLASIQMYPSNSLKRMAITLPGSEVGTGNPDLSTEVYYILNPDVNTESPASLTFSTGATKIPVVNEPVPTPSPTPTPSPSPSPDPTPQTPPAVQGISPGMLANVNFTTGINQPVVARNAVGSLDRRFQLPMELAGVTMTIGGVSVGLKRVSQRQISFVVPLGLGQNLDVPFPVVINNNGVVIKGEIIIIGARPDIFKFATNPDTNRAKILNITNRVFTRGPFDVTTLKYRGGVKIPTQVRLFITGVHSILGTEVTIRIGQTNIPGQIGNATLVEPGVYTIDFALPPELETAGDQPIIITIFRGSFFNGRLDNDAPRVRIL